MKTLIFCLILFLLFSLTESVLKTKLKYPLRQNMLGFSQPLPVRQWKLVLGIMSNAELEGEKPGEPTFRERRNAARKTWMRYSSVYHPLHNPDGEVLVLF